MSSSVSKAINIVFSPTGDVMAVMKALLAGFCSDSRTVNIFDRHTDLSYVEISKDDIAFLAVPCYGGRVPVLAAQRIAQINGNGARAVLVCSYGNRAYEDCLVELQDVAEAAGFRVVAAVAARFRAFDRASVCPRTPGQGGHRPLDGIWQGNQKDHRRKRTLCPSESPGQPSVQKGVKFGDHPPINVGLHILRHLCRTVSDTGHPSGQTCSSRQIEVHLLYALHLRLPTLRAAGPSHHRLAGKLHAQNRMQQAQVP